VAFSYGFASHELNDIRGIILETSLLRTIRNWWRLGMSTAAADEPADKTPSPEVSERIEEVSDSSIAFELTDGRSVSVPLS
jgi:hypothetical protein